MPRGRARDERRREHVRAQGGLRRLLAAHDADPRGCVDHNVRARLGDRGLGDGVLREVAVRPSERLDLVGSVAVTKLVVKGATDEPGSPCEQHLHRRRVYWGAFGLLTVVLLAGCDHGKRRTEPQPPGPKLSFVAQDREHQRLLRDYEPVSAAMTSYELSFRQWRLGRLSQATLLTRALSYREVVRHSRALVSDDRATGETRRAKRLLVAALTARAAGLAALPDLQAYRPLWDRSESSARAGLTVLQDIRDRARLIPLPEDSVS